MFNKFAFIIILIIILVIFFIKNTKLKTDSNIESKENFYTCSCKSKKYPYNPQIDTPQSNYDKIISKINSQQTYKKDLSVALEPTPTMHCRELDNKKDCNKYGCNWFGTQYTKNSNSFCSSTYPTQF